MPNYVDTQGYLQCTKMLYGFGYRIDGSKSDQNKKSPREELDGGESAEERGILLLSTEEQKGMGDTNQGSTKILPGEQEKIRQKNVIDTPYPDQVRFHKGYFNKPCLR